MFDTCLSSNSNLVADKHTYLDINFSRALNLCLSSTGGGGLLPLPKKIGQKTTEKLA